MTQCYVYIIKSTSGHYKIGISRDPRKRLRQLQRTQGPFEYSLVFYFSSPDAATAKRIETTLHENNSGYRTRGEWFALPDWAVNALLFNMGTLSGREEYERQEVYSTAFNKGVDAGRKLSEYTELPY